MKSTGGIFKRKKSVFAFCQKLKRNFRIPQQWIRKKLWSVSNSTQQGTMWILGTYLLWGETGRGQTFIMISSGGLVVEQHSHFHNTCNREIVEQGLRVTTTTATTEKTAMPSHLNTACRSEASFPGLQNIVASLQRILVSVLLHSAGQKADLALQGQ